RGRGSRGTLPGVADPLAQSHLLRRAALQARLGSPLMLRMLRIRDLAIIDELELTLEPGLNVITGETGAGKSILLQALDIVLGGRGDADLVRTGADEAVVEAVFTDLPASARALLAEA